MRLPLLDSRPVRPPAAERISVVAHRGASAEAAENTLAAIRRAIALGADHVEVDVQRSRDGALVLIHDPTLTRTTDARRVFPDRAPWRVADFTYDELARLDAGSWKSPGQTGEAVPLLEEALQLIGRSGSGVLLELKKPHLYPGIVGDVAATIAGLPGYLPPALAAGRLVVQSFDFVAMKELRALAPAVPVGLLGAPPASNLPVLASWADEVNPHHRRVDAAYVSRVHDLGMKCQVWTVDRKAALRRAISLGVDGIISNRPDVLIREAGLPSAGVPR